MALFEGALAWKCVCGNSRIQQYTLDIIYLKTALYLIYITDEILKLHANKLVLYSEV